MTDYNINDTKIFERFKSLTQQQKNIFYILTIKQTDIHNDRSDYYYYDGLIISYYHYNKKYFIKPFMKLEIKFLNIFFKRYKKNIERLILEKRLKDIYYDCITYKEPRNIR